MSAGDRTDESEHPTTLASILDAGARRWPTIAVEPDALGRGLQAHLEAAAVSSEDRAAELFLAVACVSGDSEAISIFEDEMMPAVRRALRKMRSPPDRIDEVAQVVRERLLVGTPGGPAKLAQYSGRGSLQGWLHVTAVRTYLSAVRAEGGTVPIDDSALQQIAAASGPDPELAHMKNRYRAEFEQAFQSSMSALETMEKNLLRYRFLDALSLEAICKLTGQHRATVHRQISAACAKLAHHIEQHLGEQLGLPRHELGSIRRLIRSELQLSLARVLR